MPFKSIVIGESGTGKTHSLMTLIPAGQKLRLVSIENNSLNVIKKAIKEYQVKVRAKKVPPIQEGQLGVMIPGKPKLGLADFHKAQKENLGKTTDVVMKQTDPKKKDYTRFIEVVESTVSFTDSLSGENMGLISDWGEDTTLALDSLTILCEAIKQHTIGGKVAISQPEWGMMQTTLKGYLRILTDDLLCNLVLLAHPVKEVDPNMGVTRIYPANLGVALNGEIPAMFTESIWAYTEKGLFYWSTQDKLCVTRHTFLPPSPKLEQDYKLYNLDLLKPDKTLEATE